MTTLAYIGPGTGFLAATLPFLLATAAGILAVGLLIWILLRSRRSNRDAERTEADTRG